MADVITIIYFVLRFVFRFACIVFLAWFVISYADVLANNLHSGELADWNFFKMFI